MKKSIAFWSLTIPVLVFTIWKYQSDKSCVAHTERTHCQSPFIPQMLAAAVIEKPERVNFQFNVGTRFNAINKDVVQSSTHVKAFLPNCNTDEAVAYTKVTVSILDDDRITDRSVEGTSPQLNSDQLALLAEADYSDNILIRADFIKKSIETGHMEEAYSTPYRTIAPVQQAVYAEGNTSLLNFYEEQCQEVLKGLRQQGLKSGKMYFTITANGQLKEAVITESCGYPEVDARIVSLSNELPSNWLPAVTKEGKRIDQKLVLSFGMLGC